NAGERKHPPSRGHGPFYRRKTEQVGLDRPCIRIRYVGVRRVRHRRIETCAVASGTVMKRVQKILIAVFADAGLWVGRYVGGIERAERQVDSETTREWLAAGRSVAGDTVRCTRQIGAAFDEVRI